LPAPAGPTRYCVTLDNSIDAATATAVATANQVDNDTSPGVPNISASLLAAVEVFQPAQPLRQRRRVHDRLTTVAFGTRCRSRLAEIVGFDVGRCAGG
jgi:hypothetical protein